MRDAKSGAVGRGVWLVHTLNGWSNLMVLLVIVSTEVAHW